MNIFRMITYLKADENNTRLRQGHLDAGKAPPPMRKKYRDLNNRLSRLMGHLQTGAVTLEGYMSSVSYNLLDPAPEEQGPVV